MGEKATAGKLLEQFVALIEHLSLPDGFDVKTNAEPRTCTRNYRDSAGVFGSLQDQPEVGAGIADGQVVEHTA